MIFLTASRLSFSSASMVTKPVNRQMGVAAANPNTITATLATNSGKAKIDARPSNTFRMIFMATSAAD